MTSDGVAGLKYYQELVKNSPPAATTWTWDGEGQSLTPGPGRAWRSPGASSSPASTRKDSKVKGLMEARPPAQGGAAARAAPTAGFDEIPHIGHQGGSAISLSNYSKNQEAAWIFMQWVCSQDVMARVSTLGGGASPMRNSSFKDPRVKAKAKVGPGTTRHLPGDRVDDQQRDGLRARHAALGRHLQQR